MEKQNNKLTDAEILRQKAENELTELNQFNSQIINGAHEGIIVYDLNLKYQVWNPYMENFTGLPASEVIGKHPLDIFPFLKDAGVIGILKKALKGECNSGGDFPFSIHTTGKTGWASDTTAPLFNSKNEIIGAISTVRDITESKLREDALSQNNNALNKLNQFALELSNLSSNDNLEVFIAKQVKEITGAKVAIFTEYNSADKTSTLKHIEMESGLLKKVVHLLGTQVKNIQSVISDEIYQEITKELIGVRKTLYEVSFGEIPRPVAAAIQALLKADRFIVLSFFIEGKLYGSSLLAMGIGQPYPPKEILENFIHLAATSLRRKQADKALKESEEKFITLSALFKSVFVQSPVAIELYDVSGKLIDCNPACLSFFGITDIQQVIGFNLFEDPNLTNEQKNEIKAGKHVRYEVEFDFNIVKKLNLYETTKTGKYFLDCFVTPYKTTENISIGYLLHLIDVTDSKQNEKELLESESQLLRLNADKDRFISILGHDLKSPFNNLLGLSELLTENIRKYDIDKIEKFVKLINNSARNTHNLLDDLLMWARSQQGSIAFKPENKNFTDICNDVLKTLNPTADAKNITINFLTAEHLTVFADADMLKTVLRNLVSNAIKFTNNGGVININAELDSENVTISVSDNGIGISVDNLVKMFDISEVHTTKGTANESGTGLGLLLCKEFSEKHGGVIWVESEVDKGSEFKFTLPNNNKHDEVNITKNNMSSAVADRNIAKLKILITDDDEASRMFLEILVETFTKEIISAQNGFEAVVACQDNPDIDLVLMDIKMPEMDGFEATRQIRQFNKDIVIIAQSAYSDPSDKEKAKEVGSNDFITKPIDENLLHELINKHCNR